MSLRNLRRGDVQSALDELQSRVATMEETDAALETRVDALEAAPGGGAATSRTHTITVGSTNEGDTADDCDYLDEGDGEGLRAALAAALGQTCSVFVRRGTYPLRHAGGPTTVEVNVYGEGDGTVLLLPSSGEMYSLELVGTVIQDCSIRMVGNPTGAILDSTNRFIDIQSGGALVNCLVQVNATAGTAANYPGFWSIVRIAQPMGRMVNCRVRGYSSAALGAGSECLGVMATGGYVRISNCRFGDTGSDLFDTAVELGETSNNVVENCTILRTRMYGIRLIAVFDMNGNVISGNMLDVRGGVGIGSMFVGDGIVRNTLIHGNYIECTASATAGINMAGTSGAREFDHLAIQNNVLRGAGAGTGISVTEAGGAANSNVSESLNLVYNFGTARAVAATGGGLSQVGNLP